MSDNKSSDITGNFQIESLDCSDRYMDFNRGWTFYPGAFNLFHSQNPDSTGYRIVNLLHDYMIE